MFIDRRGLRNLPRPAPAGAAGRSPQVSRPTCGVPAIRLGVDDAFVTAVPGLPAPVTFGEIFPPDHFPIWFYRSPKGPDLEIRADELPIEAITSARQRRYL